MTNDDTMRFSGKMKRKIHWSRIILLIALMLVTVVPQIIEALGISIPEFDWGLLAAGGVLFWLFLGLAVQQVSGIDFWTNYPAWCDVYYHNRLSPKDLGSAVPTYLDLAYVKNPLVAEAESKLGDSSRGILLLGPGGSGKSSSLRYILREVQNIWTRTLGFRATVPSSWHPRLAVISTVSYDGDSTRLSIFESGPVCIVIDNLQEIRSDTSLADLWSTLAKLIEKNEKMYVIATIRDHDAYRLPQFDSFTSVDFTPSENAEYMEFLEALLDESSKTHQVDVSEKVRKKLIEIAGTHKDGPLYTVAVIADAKEKGKDSISMEDLTGTPPTIPRDCKAIYANSWVGLQKSPSRCNLLRCIALLIEIGCRRRVSIVEWLYSDFFRDDPAGGKSWTNDVASLDGTIWFEVKGKENVIVSPKLPYEIVKDGYPTLDSDIERVFDTLMNGTSHLQNTRDTIDLLNGLGEYFGIVREDHLRAKDCFEKLSKLERNGRVFFNLGVANVQCNKGPDAIRAFSKATKLSPKDARPWYNLGIGYLQTGEHDKSLRALRKAVRLKPDYARAWVSLGAAYNRVHRYDDAIDALTKAREYLTEEDQNEADRLADEIRKKVNENTQG